MDILELDDSCKKKEVNSGEHTSVVLLDLARNVKVSKSGEFCNSLSNNIRE